MISVEVATLRPHAEVRLDAESLYAEFTVNGAGADGLGWKYG